MDQEGTAEAANPEDIDVEEVETEDLDDESQEDLDDDTEEDEEVEEPDGPPDEVWVLTEDDEWELVPRDEARMGYLKDKGFTQKMQDLAEKRREFEAYEKAKKEEYEERLLQWAVNVPQEPDWAELARQGYSHADILQAQKGYREQIDRAQQARHQYEAIQQERVTDAAEVIKQRMVARHPEWAVDRKAYQEGLNRMIGLANENGLSNSDLERLLMTDPRVVDALLDAVQYREISANNAKQAKKVHKDGKTLKPGSVTAKAARSTREKQAAKSRLKQSGSIEDAAAYLRSLRK